MMNNDQIYEIVHEIVEEENRLVRCKLFYDLVTEERDRLLRMKFADDYRLCKALAACYELQDYLANCIAKERLFCEDYFE